MLETEPWYLTEDDEDALTEHLNLACDCASVKKVKTDKIIKICNSIYEGLDGV